ncbi:succinylglutamate-semialdehyde dehydrogenase [Sphingomonas oligoaromativorans]|uniref:succinylglutamate-semialdehyde dehydrogenase n=1 Tax=Sphingomonas oligoaromativorans TaxID=575322 RepID=UPI00141E7A2B
MPPMLISTEPATGATLWKGVEGDPDAEVAMARGAWAEWAARPLTVRIEALRRVANMIRSRADAFAELIARETGKPLWEALTEVQSVIAKVDISVSAYSERTSQRKLEGAMQSRTALRHKPHGVLAVLGPFNFPAHLPNGHIVPALMAGNAVVFKPSEKAPASGAFLVQCFHEAGIPEGCLRLLPGGPETGQALARHPGVDGVLFTGSARAGHALHRQFAETPHKMLALEMGGNNPIVVWETPHLHAAAILCVQSAYLTAGQRCTSARRLIVRDGMHEPLLEEIARIVGRLVIDGPLAQPAPFMGPVIDNEAADHLQNAWLDLIMRGGRPIHHLQRPDAERPFLTPGLIDVTDIEKRTDEELFGPILQMVRVPDFDAALTEANATRYGLCASLITDQPALYERFWSVVRAGIINWNRPTNGAPSNAPFGGIGLSGNHRPSAYYAADYCAYPVVSGEAETIRASIGVGLREA